MVIQVIAQNWTYRTLTISTAYDYAFQDNKVSQCHILHFVQNW